MCPLALHINYQLSGHLPKLMSIKTVMHNYIYCCIVVVQSSMLRKTPQKEGKN